MELHRLPLRHGDVYAFYRRCFLGSVSAKISAGVADIGPRFRPRQTCEGRSGSQADTFQRHQPDVRFPVESRHRFGRASCPLGAIKRHWLSASHVRFALESGHRSTPSSCQLCASKRHRRTRSRGASAHLQVNQSARYEWLRTQLGKICPVRVDYAADPGTGGWIGFSS
jgi:hypothetical protein